MATTLIPAHVLRVIDANVDRCQEGLRVLEDVARFVLDDATLMGQLREARHQIAHAVAPLDLSLVAARRAQDDVGAGPDQPEEPRTALPQLVRANAKRAEEALRVLEEFARLPEMPPEMGLSAFKTARFALYDVEQKLLGRLSRQERISKIKGIYIILDPTATKDRPEVEIVEEALEGGASMVQWRDKVRDKGIQLKLLKPIRELCTQHGALLIINDDPDLALAADADGVHVGQRDLPIAAARAVLPPDRIVGASTTTVEEAQLADAQGADYIAVGAMYPTMSKTDTRPAGLITLAKVREITRRPLVAIGGINADNVEPVIAAGADAVAVISAVVSAANPRAATRHLLEKFGGSSA